jgi:hypothetical protein
MSFDSAADFDTPDFNRYNTSYFYGAALAR